jgi:hypothetical protein
VFVAPFEVSLLLAPIHLVEITIILVLLLEIGAVSTIFVVVPRMVIVAVSIVVTFFSMVYVLRPRYGGTYQCGAEHQRTLDEEAMHVIILAWDMGTLLAIRRVARRRSYERIPMRQTTSCGQVTL